MAGLMKQRMVNKVVEQRKEAKNSIKFYIGLAVAVVVLAQVAIPIIKDAISNANLSTAEKSLFGVLTIVLIAALVYAAM